ncbi:MAG TPA: ester cyclase, partial [Rhodospirillales bacterium]
MATHAQRMAVLMEHILAESLHDMEGVLDGFTADCFNDIACLPSKFIGPKAVADRYAKHWEGFPDFKVRVKRVLAADAKCIVTENEWTGTHLGTYW